MSRSVTFEIPKSPRAVIQRVGRKTVVVIRLEDASALLADLEQAVVDAKFKAGVETVADLLH